MVKLFILWKEPQPQPTTRPIGVPTLIPPLHEPITKSCLLSFLLELPRQLFFPFLSWSPALSLKPLARSEAPLAVTVDKLSPILNSIGRQLRWTRRRSRIWWSGRPARRFFFVTIHVSAAAGSSFLFPFFCSMYLDTNLERCLRPIRWVARHGPACRFGDPIFASWITVHRENKVCYHWFRGFIFGYYSKSSFVLWFIRP